MIRAVFLALCTALIAGGSARADQPLLIFAASSMTNAVQDIADAFEAAGNGPVVTVFDATSRAARQIQQGAPAHVLVSANSEWAQWLVTCGPGDAATRRQIAGNRLVVIGSQSSDHKGEPRAALAFENILPIVSEGRLAIADPVGVPAGIYAREALIGTGLWDQAQPQLVQGDTVRTVLNWVRTGTALTGIVYATDAHVAGDVEVLSEVPTDLHGAIVYEAVAVNDAPPAAHAFLSFLGGDEGQTIFAEYQFAPPPEDMHNGGPAVATECG